MPRPLDAEPVEGARERQLAELVQAPLDELALLFPQDALGLRIRDEPPVRVDDHGAPGRTDLDLAEKLAESGERDVDSVDRRDAAVLAEKRQGGGDARRTAGVEHVHIRPELVAHRRRAAIPRPRAGIEVVLRRALVHDLAERIAPIETDLARTVRRYGDQLRFDVAMLVPEHHQELSPAVRHVERCDLAVGAKQVAAELLRPFGSAGLEGRSAERLARELRHLERRREVGRDLRCDAPLQRNQQIIGEPGCSPAVAFVGVEGNPKDGADQERDRHDRNADAQNATPPMHLPVLGRSVEVDQLSAMQAP